MYTPLIYAAAFILTAFSILVVVEAIKQAIEVWLTYGKHRHLELRYQVYKFEVEDWAKTHDVCKNLQISIKDEIRNKGFGVD